MGQIVPVVTEFKYLGILFGENGVRGGMLGARDRQLKAGRFVLSEMRKRANKLKISNVRTLCYLYDTLVQPVMCYGCQLWAPYVMIKPRTNKIVMDGEQEKIHVTFLRQILGVRVGTPTQVILRELGREPTWRFWLRQIVSMWNRTSKLHDDDLFKHAIIDNVCMALGIGIHECKHECWAQSFFRCLLALGVLDPSNPMQEQVMTTNSRGNMDLKPLNYNDIIEATRQLDQAAWDAAGAKGEGDPRSISNDDNEGFKMATRWLHTQRGLHPHQIGQMHG